jgi:CspA family cold shock protein
MVRDMSDADDWRRARRSRRGRSGGSEDDFTGGGWSPSPRFPDGPGPGRPLPFGDQGRGSPRSFDDQGRGPPRVGASGPEVGAVVMRFDAERGFGFVALDDGAGDAFLHASVLRRAGVEAVVPGTRLSVRVGQGQKGPQVVEVLEVGEVGEAPPPSPRGGRSPRGLPPSDGGAGEEVRGTVKWYSAERGYGFVGPEGGGRDVFVHAAALERSGMAPLAEGQVVVMRVVRGRKGPEAEVVAQG